MRDESLNWKFFLFSLFCCYSFVDALKTSISSILARFIICLLFIILKFFNKKNSFKFSCTSNFNKIIHDRNTLMINELHIWCLLFYVRKFFCSFYFFHFICCNAKIWNSPFSVESHPDVKCGKFLNSWQAYRFKPSISYVSMPFCSYIWFSTLFVGWLGGWKELLSNNCGCCWELLCHPSSSIAQSLRWWFTILQKKETWKESRW